MSENCPTSRRTGGGDCGEGFMVAGISHSCKCAEGHEGDHWCNCKAAPGSAAPAGTTTFTARQRVDRWCRIFDDRLILNEHERAFIAEMIEEHTAALARENNALHVTAEELSTRLGAERIMRVEHLAEAVLQDNPDMDATDAAHPAWWRGNDHAYQVLCKEVNEYLDGKELGAGMCCEPWQSTRKRLVQLRKELRTLWIHLLS